MTPGAPTTRTPPQHKTNGRGVTGVIPRAAGVHYAPQPPRHTERHPRYARHARTDAQTRQPNERGKATGRQSRADPTSRTKNEDAQAREGAAADRTDDPHPTNESHPRRRTADDGRLQQNEADRRSRFRRTDGGLREPYPRLAQSRVRASIYKKTDDKGKTPLRGWLIGWCSLVVELSQKSAPVYIRRLTVPARLSFYR